MTKLLKSSNHTLTVTNITTLCLRLGWEFHNIKYTTFILNLKLNNIIIYVCVHISAFKLNQSLWLKLKIYICCKWKLFSKINKLYFIICFRWYTHNGPEPLPVLTGPRIRLLAPVLAIEAVTAEDAGVYKCSASNAGRNF